jgi:hypothetical protein
VAACPCYRDYDLPQFNQRLPGWLAWFNAERLHHSLELQTHLDILARHSGPQCRKSWPNTQSLQGITFRPNSGRDVLGASATLEFTQFDACGGSAPARLRSCVNL